MRDMADGIVMVCLSDSQFLNAPNAECLFLFVVVSGSQARH